MRRSLHSVLKCYFLRNLEHVNYNDTLRFFGYLQSFYMPVLKDIIIETSAHHYCMFLPSAGFILRHKEKCSNVFGLKRFQYRYSSSIHYSYPIFIHSIHNSLRAFFPSVKTKSAFCWYLLDGYQKFYQKADFLEIESIRFQFLQTDELWRYWNLF